jgi:hypothetical protein
MDWIGDTFLTICDVREVMAGDHPTLAVVQSN